MMKEKYVPLGVATGLVASMLIALPVFAQVNVGVGVQNGATGGVEMRGPFHGGPRGTMPPGVFGTVTAVSGDTLTVTAMARPFMNGTSTSSATTTVYTVDAANATVYKGSATTTVSVSAIAVGDKVMVQGTVSGTDVTATTIRDGLMGPGAGPGMWSGKGGPGRSSTSTPKTPIIQGNGEPVVGGTIAAVSGDTVTVTNASDVTYTVDVTNATIVKNGTTTTVSGLVTGDTVVVQGTVNGTSITASSVLDQGAKPAVASSTTAKGSFGVRFQGFFGAIGGFFAHLFGF